tara:strand:- start:8286 stop:9569 length:1284 start_codon:yes stop_codon:yes gene_type:complete
MKVLLIGSGGREHALAWALSQSPLCDTLFIAPGNPGTQACGVNVALNALDFEKVLEFIEKKEIGLTVVGPEQPLVAGISDFLEGKGHSVFGPSTVAARLEGSKQFAKDFMVRHDIPTAAYKAFEGDYFTQVLEYVDAKNEYPVVLKADGLAGGKGVLIPENREELLAGLEELFKGTLRAAAQTLVLEEFMPGEEASVFALCDGEHFEIIGTAQDHKRQLDGDKGPNTGGMGAYSPSPLLQKDMLQMVSEQIIAPTVAGMAAEGNPFKGFLYVGLMMTPEGPKVVEFNCRFGDPECQVIIPRLQSDLLTHLVQSTKGALQGEDIVFDDQYRTTVVLVSGGYPLSYQKDFPIFGVDKIQQTDDFQIFHAGTKQYGGQLCTAGGRVLNVVGTGKTLHESISMAYKGLEAISFEDMFYRKDIGAKGLNHVS